MSYQYNKKVVNMSNSTLKMVVAILTGMTLTFAWLAVRNSKPAECLPYSVKVYEDNTATCLIQIQENNE